MPTTTLYSRTGEEIGEVELSEELFAAPINTAVLHQVVIAQLAGRHLGTHSPRSVARLPAAARSLTARRGPVGPARAPSDRRTTEAAAWSSDRSRARTCSVCPAR
jgi:large subunit ribosomal protein L4